MITTFIGQIEGRTDEKGRIFIPASYRKILAQMESRSVIMRRDTDNECIVFYPEYIWQEKVEQLRRSLNEWDPDDQMLLMQFMSDAEQLDMDNQGRVLLSRKVLETINVQQDVVFIGMMDRFALWSPDTFQQKKNSPQELAARLKAKMIRPQ